MYRKTYVEVILDALKENVRGIITNYSGYQYYIGVVKGNAYGHGYYSVKELIEGGINYLAVSSLEEALEVRQFAQSIPILCLEPIDLEYLNVCLKENITITIHDVVYLKELIRTPFEGRIKFHLKLDTGMNRLGLKTVEEVSLVMKELGEHPKLFMEGIYTHFMTPGISDALWDQQLAKFRELVAGIDLKKVPIIHLGRSLTLVNHPKIDICTGIRLGIILYGFDQTPHGGKGLKNQLRKIKTQFRIKKEHISETTVECKITPLPALSFYSEVIQVKRISKGEFVGYGTSYRALSDGVIAVLSVGYADGLCLRNQGRDVVIRGKRYPIIGVIGMGLLAVLVDGSIKTHDEVTLLGEGITIREVSRYVKTTVYQLMCSIPSDLPRVYRKNGKVVYILERKL